MHVNLKSILALAAVLSLPLTSLSRAVPQSNDLSFAGNAWPDSFQHVDIDGTERIHDEHHHQARSPVVPVPKPKPDVPDPTVPEPDTPQPANPNDPSNPITLVSAADPNAPKATEDPGQPIRISSAGAPSAPQATEDPSLPILISSAKPPSSPKATNKPSASVPGPSAASGAPPKATGGGTAPPAASVPAAPSPAFPPGCKVKRSADGLIVRSDCDPTSLGDGGADGGGIASDPPGAEQIAPHKNREDVTNWYDVLEMNPVPLHKARSALEGRLQGIGSDKVPGNMDTHFILGAPNDGSHMESDLQKILDGNGVTGISQNSQTNTVYLKNQLNKASTIVEITAFSDDGKLITAEWSFLRANGKPLGDLRWSDLVFLQYKAYVESKGLGTNALEHVAQANVVNDATVKTIETAYTEMNLPNGMATFHLRTTDAKEQAAFDALSRSDNVNGVYWLLSDFNQALGGKQVTAIHTNYVKGAGDAWIVIDIGF